MTKKMKLVWWLYAFTTVIVPFFVVPKLVSLPDTLAVIFGLLLLLAFGIWSWELWISGLITKAKELLDEKDSTR